MGDENRDSAKEKKVSMGILEEESGVARKRAHENDLISTTGRLLGLGLYQLKA